MKKRLWFRAKTYGWGWTPSSWQGWLIVALWCAVYAGIIAVCDMWFHESWSGTLVAIVVGFVWVWVLVYISYKTGEPPHWRWGKDTKRKGDTE